MNLVKYVNESKEPMLELINLSRTRSAPLIRGGRIMSYAYEPMDTLGLHVKCDKNTLLFINERMQLETPMEIKTSNINGLGVDTKIKLWHILRVEGVSEEEGVYTLTIICRRLEMIRNELS